MTNTDSERNGTSGEEMELLMQDHLLPDRLRAGLMLLSTEGHMVWANSYARHFLGYSSSEIKALHLLNLFEEEYHKMVLRAFSRFTQIKKAHTGEWKMKTKSGTTAFIRTESKLVELKSRHHILTLFHDITPQCEVERKLRLTNKRLQGLVNNISIYLWTLDKDLCFVTANEAAIRVFKSSFDYDFTPGDFVMELYQKRKHKEENLWLENYHAVQDKEESRYFELAEIFYGRFLHISAELHPIRSKDGVYGISCLVRNDTDSYLKNQLNEALSDFKSKALYIKSVNDLLWAITDEVLSELHLEDAVILMRNGDFLEAKTAYGAKRISNKKIDSPLKIRVGQGVTGSAVLNGTIELVNDVTQDSRYFEVHFTAGSEVAVPIKIGSEVVGVINCESSHKNFFKKIHLEILEELAQFTADRIQQITFDGKIRKIEELNRAVLNSTPNSYLLLNKNKEIESFNKIAYKVLTGYNGQELVRGKNYLDYVPEEYIPEFDEMFQRALSGRIGQSEKKYVNARSEEVWVRRTLAPAINRQRSVFGVTVILEDISEQKKAENLIMDQNRELMKTNAELDRFVYSVSHDLRSPVSSVMGLANLIRENQSIEEIRHFNELIIQSMIKMDRFIRNILDYSKNSRTELKPELIDVNDLLDRLIADHTYEKNCEGIEIKRTVTHSSICSDRERLKVVLSNLVSNSIKYHNRGRRDMFIHIVVSKITEGLVYLEVADNGQGIEEEHLPHLFNMFYTANIRAQGSGIGLYILKETVDMLGGKVEVKSKQGEGSKFMIKLPELTEQVTL